MAPRAMAHRALSSDTTSHATIGMSTLADNPSPPINQRNDNDYTFPDSSLEASTTNLVEAIVGRDPYIRPWNPKSSSTSRGSPHLHSRHRSQSSATSKDSQFARGQKRYTSAPQYPSNPPSTSSIMDSILEDDRPFRNRPRASTVPSDSQTLHTKPSPPQQQCRPITGDRELIARLEADFREAKRQMHIKDEKISALQSEIETKKSRIMNLEKEVKASPTPFDLAAKDEKILAMQSKIRILEKALRAAPAASEHAAQGAELRASREKEIRLMSRVISKNGDILKLQSENSELRRALMLAWGEKECPGEKDASGRQKYRYRYERV